MQPMPLDGAGSELRLRLVNGWVWINDVDTGAAWVTSPQQRLDRVEDWGSILSDLDDDDRRRQHRRGGRRGHHRGQPRRPQRRDRAVRRDRRGGPEQAADRPRRRGADPRRPADRHRRAGQRHRPQRRRPRRHRRRAGRRRRRDRDRPRRSQRAGLPGRRLRRADHVRLHDHRRARRQRVGERRRPGRGRPTARDNRPPEAHNDIASTRRGRPTTFDVLGQRRRPRRRRPRARLDRPARTRRRRRRARARPVRPGRVHAGPEHDVGAHRADLHGERRLRRHRRGHRHRRRCAWRTPTTSPTPATTPASPSSASRSASTCWPTTPTPTTTRCSSPSSRRSCARPTAPPTALDLSLTPDGELFFNPDAAGTYVFNYSATDGEETDVAQIRIEVGAADREPAADRRPRRRRHPRRRLPPRVRDGERRRPRRRRHRPRRPRRRRRQRADGARRSRASATSSRSRPARRPARRSATRSPTAGPTRSAPSSSSPSPTASPSTSRRSPAPTSPRCAPAARSTCRCWRTTTTPRAAPSRSSTSRRSRASTSAPGLNGQTVDVRVGAGVISSFTLSYTVADAAGNRSSAFVEVRIVPADEVNRPPIARTDIARTRSGVRCAIQAVANDSDPDGDIIAVESIRTQPTGGIASVEAGAVVYTPNDTFAGTDRFTYALVDAGGEIAIGEVLVGVMPLAGENRAPEAFDDAVQAVAGSAPLVFDVLDNDSDPDGDRLRVTTVGTPTSGGGRGRRRGRRRRVHAAGRGRDADGTAAEVAFTYAIDDGRGGTASATVTVARDRRRRGDRARRRRRPGRPDRARPVGRDRPARQRPRPRRQPGRARRRAPPTRRSPTATAASSRSPPARRRAATPTRSPIPTASPTRPRSTSSSCPTGPRSSQPYAAQTPANTPITIDLAAQATDPDGDTLYFSCCDNPQGGAATTVANGAGELTRDVRPRRRLRRAGDVRLHRRRPAGPQRRRRGDDRRAPADATGRRSPTDAMLTVEAGTPTNIDLAALVTDPDPNDTLTYTIDRPGLGRRRAGPDGATVQATAPLEGTDAHRLVPVHRHRRRRRDGDGDGVAHRHAAGRPAARRPSGDAATTNQGQAVTVAVLGNDLDPLGRGLTVTSVGATAAGIGDDRRRTGHVHAERRLLRPDVVHLPRPRRRQLGVARVRGAGRRHRHRPAVGAGHARAREGNATATVTWAAPPSNGAPIDDYELRMRGRGARRSAPRPATRGTG